MKTCRNNCIPLIAIEIPAYTMFLELTDRKKYIFIFHSLLPLDMRPRWLFNFMGEITHITVFYNVKSKKANWIMFRMGFRMYVWSGCARVREAGSPALPDSGQGHGPRRLLRLLQPGSHAAHPGARRKPERRTQATSHLGQGTALLSSLILHRYPTLSFKDSFG